MTKVIGVYNAKGGVAKTVTTLNVAARLADIGHRVLVCDCDPQSSLTINLDSFTSDKPSMFDVLTSNIDIKDVIVKTHINANLDLVPSNYSMFVAEHTIISNPKKNPATRLSRKLKSVIISNEYDFIFLDSPPSLSTLTTNVLVASDYVIVPIKPSKYSVDGFRYLMSHLNEIREEYNDVEILGIVFTMVRNTRVDRDLRKWLTEALSKDLVFKTSIRLNTDLEKAVLNNQAVVTYIKKAISAKDYSSLTSEIVERLGE